MCADNAAAPLFLLLWQGFMGRSPWNAPTEQPKSCLVLKSCLCARFCPSLLQDRKRNYPSFSPPSAHKGKKKTGEVGVLSQCAACIFMAAACDSSTYSRLSLPVPGSCRLCRYDGLQEEIRGGDNLRINTAFLPSSAAGRFSQTMTQSLGVAYFRLLLVRSSSSQAEVRWVAPETFRVLFGIKGNTDVQARLTTTHSYWIQPNSFLNSFLKINKCKAVALQ